MNAAKTFAIVLNRLPRIADAPGLISLKVNGSGGAGTSTRRCVLTDAALRGRLAHFNAHSANEIAAIRKALAIEEGKATIYENWSGLAGCIKFWYGFVGSQIRPIPWTCEKCGAPNQDSIGGCVGESFLRRCACGEAARLTVPKYAPAVPAAAA